MRLREVHERMVDVFQNNTININRKEEEGEL